MAVFVRPISVTRAWDRLLGVEEGHRYGTILCDMEERKVIDLLPDREAATVTTWLRQHPGAEIVSRDRGGI